MTNANLEHKVQLELVGLLYRQVSSVLWAESLAALCVAFTLWGEINPYLLIGWLISNLLLCGLSRHLLVWFYKRSLRKKEINHHNIKFWRRAFALGALLSGISWGAIGSVLMVPDMNKQIFNIFLLFGVTAVANPLYSSIRYIYFLFLIAAFLPFSLWLFFQGGPFIILGLLAIVYMMIMLIIAFYSNSLITNTLYLHLENASLVKNLSTAKINLETRTQELEKLLAKLFHQAHFDPLTGLPNRILLLDRINNAITFVKEKKMHIGILFLDLDRFKVINDTLGHAVGDELLKEVGSRIESILTQYDTVSREGGDEFVIIISKLHHETDILEVAKKLLYTLREPIHASGHKINISASIGISLYPKDGLDAETLIKNSDMAMYHAKEVGRNNYQFFSEEMNKKILSRLVLERQLRDALEENEFYLEYQPIVSLKTGKIVKLEALLRWHHQKLGSIPPDDFIKLAEETGMIEQIGRWVLSSACRHLKAWQAQGLSGFRVAVNLSSRQFKQPNFLDIIQEVITENKVDPKCLALELTESLLMENVESAIQTLRSLKALGVRIIVDDFGTGYSSLNYLKQFPVDVLKIDKTFINDVPMYADDVVIISAIIALASRLKLLVIAEGVENQEQVDFLIQQNCDEVQGYYFSHPLSFEACEALLKTNARTPYEF